MPPMSLNLAAYNSKLLKNTIIKQASSDIELNELLEITKKLNTGNNFIQLFDANAIINKEHILAAYLNTVNSFKEKQNRSKNIAIELLLFIAMSKQINEAISLVGIKNKSNFIVFSNNYEKYKKFKYYLKKENNFLPPISHIRISAKKYKLKIKPANKKELKNLINIEMFQKIAISKIKD